MTTYNLLQRNGNFLTTVNPSGPGDHSFLYSGSVITAPAPGKFDIFQYVGDGTGTRVIPTTLDLSTGGFVHVIQSTSPFECLMLFSADGTNVYRSPAATFGTVATTRVVAPYAFGNGTFTVSSAQNTSGVVYTVWAWRRYPGFFDVVRYVGGTLGVLRQIPHSLGVTPDFLMVRGTALFANSASMKLHIPLVNTVNQYFTMESTGPENTTAGSWGTTGPSSTYFEVKDWSGNNGGDPANTGWLMNLWVNDVSNGVASGTYVGNANVVGPTITCGFQPELILVKRNATSGNWCLIDQIRNPGFSGSESVFRQNLADLQTINAVTLTSNGFQIVTTDTQWNASGSTYIYLAFARV